MKTDDYKFSKSDSQTYSDMMKRLNNDEELVKRMISGEINKGDNAIDIATRQGQRKIMIDFRRKLILLRNNIRQAVKYLQTQADNLSVAMRCENFKYDMCKAHEPDFAALYTEKLCNSIKDDCLSENSDSCSGDLSCEQIGIQKCNNEFDKCSPVAKNIFSEIMRDRCDTTSDNAPVGTYSVLEEKEMAEGFRDSLNTEEKLTELLKIYTVLPFDISSTNSILQKLENYKPFDECGEKLCSLSDDSYECQTMAWSNPDKKISFIDGKCGELPNEIKEKCALLKDQNEINSCEEKWKNECNAEWTQKTGSIVKEGGVEKEIFGACYTRKVFVISDGYDDFTKNLEENIKAQCGENPSQRCSDDVLALIDDPLNKCIKKEIPACMTITKKNSMQCYNDLITPLQESSSVSEFTGKCYDKQYRDLTYDSLVNNDDTKITNSDMEFIKEVQDKKHEEYSNLEDRLKQNLLSMSRNGEKCYDKSAIKDGTYNKYELENACVINAMNRCAPVALTGDALEYMTGVDRNWHGRGSRIHFRFSDKEQPAYETWESFWRGCYKCTTCLESKCKDNMDCSDLCENECSFEPQCKIWWLRKDSFSPFEMPSSSAKKIDIWNINLSKRYWPNTEWPKLFEINDDEMENIKAVYQNETEDINPVIQEEQPLAQDNTDIPVQTSCCD